jgi:hypothetical protein
VKLVVGATGSDEILQFWRLSVVKLTNLPNTTKNSMSYESLVHGCWVGL